MNPTPTVKSDTRTPLNPKAPNPSCVRLVEDSQLAVGRLGVSRIEVNSAIQDGAVHILGERELRLLRALKGNSSEFGVRPVER